jgi:uncharacterized protein YbjT (DUF2867 family)
MEAAERHAKGHEEGVTAFVAGATGYTGRALVRELRARGVRTIAHVRPDSPRLGEWQRRFAEHGATVDTTAWDEDALAGSLHRHGADLVFALLGTTRRRSRDSGAGDSYETVDYGLTSLLLRATQRGAPDARFVYLSAIGVGPRARGGYLRARWRVEQELRASGIDHVVVRPAFITGPDRDEARPAERAAAILVDALLSVAAALGARRLRERYRSRTGDELGREICDRVLSR